MSLSSGQCCDQAIVTEVGEILLCLRCSMLHSSFSEAPWDTMGRKTRRKRQRRDVDVLVTLLQVANFKAEVAIFSNVVTTEIVFQAWLSLPLAAR